MFDQPSATEKVINYFIKQIENGNWKIGDQIDSENTLTKKIGVSRTSVRAAIQQLKGINLIESVHGKGTFLKSDDLSRLGLEKYNKKEYDYVDMKSLLEFRLVLETDSVYYAAKRASKDTIENLEHYLEKMKDSVGNPDQFVRFDRLFHEEIIKATNNKLLEDALKEAFSKKEARLHDFNDVFGYKDGIYYHTLLLKAIRDKNAPRAKRIMRTHLQKAIDDIYYNEEATEEEKQYHRENEVKRNSSLM